MDNNIIYIAVFTAQEKNYDDECKSWMPTFDSILCASHDENAVYNVVFKTVHDNRYSILDTTWYNNYDGIGESVFTFRYTDQSFGGYCDYTLEVRRVHLDDFRPKTKT